MVSKRSIQLSEKKSCVGPFFYYTYIFVYVSSTSHVAICFDMHAWGMARSKENISRSKKITHVLISFKKKNNVDPTKNCMMLRNKGCKTGNISLFRCPFERLLAFRFQPWKFIHFMRNAIKHRPQK